MKKSSSLESVWWFGMRTLSVGLALILASSFSACMRNRSVYIPPEWKAPPPQAGIGQGHAAPSNNTGGSTGAIIRPDTGFKESNLPTGPESAIEPGAMRKNEPVAPQQQPPQRLASMHLVDQGKASLAQGKPDAAIPFFEQAIQVDVHNGDAFFGLAKAWRLKGSRNKAQEFARKAEILFQDNGPKLKEVCLFQADIYKELGDTQKMQFYQDKASKL